jgi:hypothetical protein
MTEMQKFQIPVEKLRRACDCEKELNFCESSKDVAPFETVIGQDRALRAMQFGLMMDLPDYHIFVVGPQGTGKSTFTQSTVSKRRWPERFRMIGAIFTISVIRISRSPFRSTGNGTRVS